ncbi:hypothetical protein [Salinibacter ruber]|uniref:hypothetical protein n=1 Tax=Salinibacter ruber TaxID=146919 RepID=UPI002166D936|nr:hypothetical protein [Salinibacter ruber]MCS4198474.1 hypothetical protein [Salinibacter ruber]
MSLFGIFSDDDCGETEAYLESIADFFESVLRNELRAPVDHPTGDTEVQAKVLLAYMVLACIVTSKENPNVDLDCELAVGGVLQPRLREWTSIAQSSDIQDRLSKHGAKAVMAGAGYGEGMEQVWKFVFERHSETGGPPIDSIDSLFKAENILFEAINRHDADRHYEEWVSDAVAVKDAKDYGQEMADRIGTHLAENYQIDANSGELSRHEEAVVGTFFLCCLLRLVGLGGEGKALLSTSSLTLRQELKGLPTDEKMLNVSYSVLLSPSNTDGEKHVKNILSWAIAHSKNKEFELGDDLTSMDYSGEKSLMSVLDDALKLHGV